MDKEQFVIDDFKLKLEYLRGQYSRLWQRLGFFLTLETALFGLYGWLAFGQNPNATWVACTLGIIVSFIWYVVAAQDRFLVVQYRRRLTEAAKQVGEIAELQHYENTHPGMGVKSGFVNLLCWYCRPISITKLPVWVALALSVFWIVLIFVDPTATVPQKHTDSTGITISGKKIKDAGSIVISDSELRIEAKTE